jgi:tRNA threonylcarbamoyladenosine modification (KEOPS) complex  Pcc1 subunit
MRFSAEILVKEDLSNIEELFKPEEKAFQNQRACYELRKTKQGLVFKITAKDSSALRAVLNSITKLLSVYEGTKSVVKEE